MKADPLVVGEQAQEKKQRRSDKTDHADESPRTWQIAATPALAQGEHQEHEQGRRHQQELDRQPGKAIDVELPGIAVDELETQTGAGMVKVPFEQGPPCGRAEGQHAPHASIAQQTPRRFVGQHGKHSREHHQHESVVRQGACDQCEGQQSECHRIDPFPQPGDGLQAQQRGEHHRHVRHGQHAQQARQGHQRGEQARLRARRFAEPTPRKAPGQPRHRPAQQ